MAQPRPCAKSKNPVGGAAMTDALFLSNSLADLAARIKAEHEATAIAMRRGVEHAMAAGDLLLEAKAQLKHGEWLPWLAAHCISLNAQRASTCALHSTGRNSITKSATLPI